MMGSAVAETFETVERKRRDFAQALAQFRGKGGRYHNPAPPLPDEKYRGCEVLTDRLALLDKLPKGAAIAEVGVDRGFFAAEILSRCAPSSLSLIDREFGRLASPMVLELVARKDPRITLLRGDSADCLAELPASSFDVVYIDADHSYAAVRRDIAAALPCHKPNGVLVFNDYAVWSPSSMYHCGVARAVNELCLTSNWRLKYLAMQPMMYNDGMLVRG
jgi:predicted O-methyltransferase YrrM